MLPKINFDIKPELKDKLTVITEIDKRSIQKEIEWLIEQRYSELTINKERQGKEVQGD